MTEDQIFEVLSGAGQSVTTIGLLALWARAELIKLRDSWAEQIKTSIKEEVIEIENRLRTEIRETKITLAELADGTQKLREDFESFRTEQSRTVQVMRQEIARLEGRFLGRSSE